MARVCLYFMCEQARHRARASEQAPQAAGELAQDSVGHSNAAPSPQSFLPGFASGFLSKKSGCASLGACSSSPRRRARQASPPDVVARPRVSVADRTRGKKPRQGDRPRTQHTPHTTHISTTPSPYAPTPTPSLTDDRPSPPPPTPPPRHPSSSLTAASRSSSTTATHSVYLRGAR
jgi:hypothetical protein